MIGLILLFIFLLATPCFSEEEIDIAKAINYALVQNRELVRSALSIDSRALGITTAEVEFQVSIRPEASMGITGGRETLGYGLGVSKKLIHGTELSAVSRESGVGGDTSRRGSIQLEIRQPIFRNFGSLIHEESLIQSRNNLKTARRRLEMQKGDLIVRVVETYENIFKFKHQVKAAQESFNRMDALYRITKAKELLGRTTRIDTLRVDLLRGQALSLLESSRERFGSAQRDFAELLGFAPDTVFDLKPSPLLQFEVPETENAVKIALENRLDYAQVIQDSEDGERGVRIAEKRLLPDLKLTGRHEWFGEGRNPSDAWSLDKNGWFIGLSVDTDFNLTRERAQLSEAQINQTSSRQTVEIIELSIAREIQQSLLIYQRVQEELKIAEKNLGLAEARSKFARRLFEIGKGDNFSVTDAERAHLQAGNQLFSAQAEAVISGYRLFRVLGTLVESPEGLKPRRVN